MNWKKLSYPFKGGIITLITIIILFIIWELMNEPLEFQIIFLPIVLLSFGCGFEGRFCGISLIIIPAIFYFLLGSIIGLIYGKIKNRKKA